MSYMTKLPGVPDTDDLKPGMAIFEAPGLPAKHARAALTVATGAPVSTSSTRKPKCSKRRGATRTVARCFSS